MHKKTILVADDCKSFVMYMALLLQRMGFNVVPADNGLEVTRLIRIARPDLILLDYNMPYLNGMDTLEVIVRDKEMSLVPVVMVTAEAGEDIRSKCIHLGAVGYLTKPIHLNELHNILQECIYSPLGFRRNHLRVNHQIKVNVDRNGEMLDLSTETLSEGGVFIRSNSPLPVGTKIKVTLCLDNNWELKLNGRVIYIKNLFGDALMPSGMAVQFDGINQDESAVLTSFIKSLVTEGIETVI